MTALSPRWMTWAFCFLLAFSMLAGALVLIPENARADPINATIYSGPDDRVLWETGSVYDTAHDDTSANGGSYNATTANSDIIHNSYPAGYIIARDVIFFDLSALPDDGAVVSATISLFIDSVLCQDGAPQTGISVCPGEPGYPSARPAVASDFDLTKIATPADSLTSFTNGAYNAFDIPIGNIVLGSWNGYYLRMKGDVDDAAPTSGKINEVYMWLGGAILENHRPKMDVSYTEGTPPEPEPWAPAFTSTPDLTGTTNESYSYSPTCNESVTYSLETKPDWAIMDEGEISGTPLLAGDYDFELKATSDGGGLDAWQNWTVTVPDPGVPPVTIPFSDITELLASLLTILLMVVLMVAILTGIKRW